MHYYNLFVHFYFVKTVHSYFIILIFIPSETNKKPRYSKEERQYILNKKKEIRLKRKNRKKAILLNIA